MGVCQTKKKDSKNTENNFPTKLSASNAFASNKNNNFDPNKDKEVRRSQQPNAKEEIDMNEIDIGMSNDPQYSPSKAGVNESNRQDTHTHVLSALNYNAICPNCSSRIAKIVSIIYDKSQMGYVLKVKCSCVRELKEYQLKAFKNDLTPKTDCQSHQGQKLNLYCNQCSVDICQQCRDQDHSNHNVIDEASQPQISIEELNQVVEEKKNHFIRLYSAKETEFKKQCDELETLLHSIRNGGNEHLKDFYNENMNLFDFVKASYSQYQKYANMNQLSVGMINLANDLKLSDKYDADKDQIEFNMCKDLNGLRAVIDKQIQDYSLSLNYDLFEAKQINQKQFNCATTLEAHTDNVICLLLLNNGKLASGSYDQTIKLWDLRSNQCAVIREKGNVLCFLEFVPGKLLAGTSVNSISLWDIESKESDFVFLGHILWVNCLVKINQKQFASGSNDKTIRLWDYYSKKLIKVLKMESDCIFALCLISENYLASGSGDNLIRVWNVAEGTCINWGKKHTKWVKCLCVLSTGKLLSGSDDHTIIVWDDSKYFKTLHGHQDSVRALSQINNHQFASGSFDTSIMIWNILTYECEQTIMSHTSLVICIIPINDKSFASCSNDKTIKIWY